MAADPLVFEVPPGACDCHIHINDPRFPYQPGAMLTPPPATLDDYRAVQQSLGMRRVVVVQPSSYGTDNRSTLDAVARLGPEFARAVVVVPEDVDPQTLAQLRRQGARGVRVNLARGSALGASRLEALAARLQSTDLHLQLHGHADVLAELAPTLLRLPVVLVVDHMGRIPPQAGVNHPTFALLRRLLDEGRTWVKLSGAYMDSQSGGPDYVDRLPVASALAAAAPERVVWGSDWPFPSATAGERPVPDPVALLALLERWVPEAALRKRVLVDNPQLLYGF